MKIDHCGICKETGLKRVVCSDCFKELRQMVFRINKDFARMSVELKETKKQLDVYKTTYELEKLKEDEE